MNQKKGFWNRIYLKLMRIKRKGKLLEGAMQKERGERLFCRDYCTETGEIEQARHR